MTVSPVVVWFRQDLRLTDNPALHAVAKSGRPVVAVYILDDDQPWPPGGASRWWLHGSLTALARSLAKSSVPLVFRRGKTEMVLPKLITECGAEAAYWNRCYEPHAVARDARIKAALKADSIAAESFNGALLFEPWKVKTQSGTPFKVFTPFWRAALRIPVRAVLPAPKKLASYSSALKSDILDNWNLRPSKPDWAGGLREAWQPGETGARKNLDIFLESSAAAYAKGRDIPAAPGTSRLSPHLHFGEISPVQVWHAANSAEPSSGTAAFLRELIWREFSHHLLYHFPQMPDRPLRPAFADFPWAGGTKHLRAWQQGRTGYPIVDAGMRELWHTGWMHNRVRMIAASFLVKHLLLPWQKGAAWFWDILVDADLANNSAGWQWVAGCGADAAPYFRVFNPVLQGEKFDAAGAYVRRWVPEIAGLPDSYIHRPWDAPMNVLAAAGLRLGKDYPLPIVDHETAREWALAVFNALKS